MRRAKLLAGSALNKDAYVEIFAQLPELHDKLAFASTCKTAREASESPRCWETVDVSSVACSMGEAPSCLQSSSSPLTSDKLNEVQQFSEPLKPLKQVSGQTNTSTSNIAITLCAFALTDFR